MGVGPGLHSLPGILLFPVWDGVGGLCLCKPLSQQALPPVPELSSVFPPCHTYARQSAQGHCKDMGFANQRFQVGFQPVLARSPLNGFSSSVLLSVFPNTIRSK